MKRKLTYFVASFVIAVTAALAFASTSTSALGSCQTQCRVGYDKCNRQATNPGGLNQCKKAFDACLATCR